MKMTRNARQESGEGGGLVKGNVICINNAHRNIDIDRHIHSHT